MAKRIKRLFSQREVLKNLIVRNIKTKYIGSILGISWAIITPLLIMLAISFIFAKVMTINVEHFPLFVLCAILPWIFFSSSLSESTPSIINNAHLLNQFSLLKEVLPVSCVLANFINFLFGLLAMMPIFLIFRIQILPFLLCLPLALLLQLIFTIGIALLFSSINVYFRDLNHLLGVGLMFWFWLTPIFYSLEMVPERYRWVSLLNPMTFYITIYRDILFKARVPHGYILLAATGIALGTLTIGYATFVKLERSFAKRI